MRRTPIIAIATGLVLAAQVAVADAAVTVGSDLSREAFAFSVGRQTEVTLSNPTGSTLPASVPSDGTIVSASAKHGPTSNSGAAFGFRVLSGTFPTLTARALDGAPDREWPRNAPAGVETLVPVNGAGVPRGVPVRAGERLALVLYGGDQPATSSSFVFVGGLQRGTFAEVHEPGTTQTYSGPFNSTFEALYNYVVEPDADGDAFGDETQDCAPSDAGKATDCDPPSANLTKTPKSKTKASTAAFRFASDDPGASFECGINKKPLAPCTSPKKFRNLKPRKYKLKLQATDSVGNVGELTRFRWRVVD